MRKLLPLTRHRDKLEEIRQIKALARVLALREYDPDLGMPWTQFLRLHIDNAIDAMNRQVRRMKKAKLVVMARHRESPPSSPDLASALWHADAAGKAMANLNPEEREAVILVFQLGLTYRQAANALGKTPQAVRRARDRAISKMREVPLPTP